MSTPEDALPQCLTLGNQIALSRERAFLSQWLARHLQLLLSVGSSFYKNVLISITKVQLLPSGTPGSKPRKTGKFYSLHKEISE